LRRRAVAAHHAPRGEHSMKKFGLVHTFVGVLVLCLACAAPQRVATPLPTSRWNGKYSFRWDPPEERHVGEPLGMTICVVEPRSDNEDGLLVDRTYKNFAKGFGRSMAADLDRVFTTKGLTVSGPFSAFDEITYPDKKSAQFAFTPELFITADVKSGELYFNGDYHSKTITMEVRGQLILELREPLSNQKLWVKRIELEPRTVTSQECYADSYQLLPGGYYGNVPTDRLLYDGKQDAVADYMAGQYSNLMQRTWTYIDVDELAALLASVKEIREAKRY
jgi:hypothetical protein